MRHDKSKPLPHPMTLSQALSRPWVQTRELRRDQGIVTCLNEFWLTAHRCAPKEKPPTQPPRCAHGLPADGARGVVHLRKLAGPLAARGSRGRGAAPSA